MLQQFIFITVYEIDIYHVLNVTTDKNNSKIITCNKFEIHTSGKNSRCIYNLATIPLG